MTSKKRKLPFRAWFYFRQGWSLYFAFIFAAINTLVVTYYLAIEKIPSLEIIFPSFTQYVVIIISIGLPLLILIGYVHFKRSHAYGSEVDITYEANPYLYKLPPGYWKEALFPVLLEILRLNLKLINKETLTNEEVENLKEIQKKLETLVQGGHVGKPKHLSI